MNVEDRAFGVADEEPPRSVSDTAALFMLPLTVTLMVVAIVSYSLCKAIEYQELFARDARYRRGLILVNALVIIVAAVVVGRSAHEEAMASVRARADGEQLCTMTK